MPFCGTNFNSFSSWEKQANHCGLWQAELIFCLSEKQNLCAELQYADTVPWCLLSRQHDKPEGIRSINTSISLLSDENVATSPLEIHKQVIVKLKNSYSLIHPKQTLQKLACKNTFFGFSLPRERKAKPLQRSEQYGLVVEAKWITAAWITWSSRGSILGRSDYICLIAVQARTEHLIKTPWFCLPELIIHSSKLPSALK